MRPLRAPRNASYFTTEDGVTLCFEPTNMSGFSYVIYVARRPGPIGWLPSGTQINEATAALALDGGYFE